jgi:hypothetical protein
MKRKFVLFTLIFALIIVIIYAGYVNYDANLGTFENLRRSYSGVRDLVATIVFIITLLGFSLYISRIFDNDHFLKGAEGLEMVTISRVHSDKRDTLLAFFGNGTGAYSSSEIATSTTLLPRAAVSDASKAFSDGKIVIMIRGDESSGKTILLWQIGVGLNLKDGWFRFIGNKTISASAAKIGKSTFEALYRRLYLARLFLPKNYIVLIDDFDAMPPQVVKGYVASALAQEEKYRNSWLGSKLPWGRVTYVIVSELLDFDARLQATVSTRLLPGEEQPLLSALNQELVKSGATPLELRAFWLKVGGRRSYESSISSFVANYLIATGRQRDMIPDEIESSPPLKQAAKFLAAFTIISMPVPLRLIPTDIRETIERHRDSSGGKIFIRAEIDEVQGMRLRLKPWAFALLGIEPDDMEGFLAKSYGGAIETIGIGATTSNYIEWARTLLHRLHKRRHIGLIEFDGEAVGERVVREHIDLIKKWVMNERRVESLCFWAGTFASVRAQSDKMAYPDLVVECIRRVAIADASILNELPKSFISFAKAVGALRHLPPGFDTALSDGALLQAAEILKIIDITEVIKADYNFNSQGDWQFRYSQSILSYFKIKKALIPKKPHDIYLRKWAEYNREVVAFVDEIENKFSRYNVVNTASILSMKARAQMDLGYTERAIETYTKACEIVTGELREWAEAGLSIHRERAKAILRHRPEDTVEILRTFVSLFDDLANHSDFLSSQSFTAPFDDFLSLCEQQPQLVKSLLGEELFSGTARSCLDKFSEGSLVVGRYTSVLQNALRRVRFPRSAASGNCIQEFLVGFHSHLEEALREVADKEALSQSLATILWGSGLTLKSSSGTIKLLRKTDHMGVK